MIDKIINLEILKNPYNWILIWAVLAIFILGITYLLQSTTPPVVANS